MNGERLRSPVVFPCDWENRLCADAPVTSAMLIVGGVCLLTESGMHILLHLYIGRRSMSHGESKCTDGKNLVAGGLAPVSLLASSRADMMEQLEAR